MVLAELKKEAEMKTGKEVKYVVISVPAYYKKSQNEETVEAAKIAGLEVMKLVPEPVATALTYCHSHKKLDEKKYVMVIDIGGDSLDITAVFVDEKNDEGVFEV